MILAQSISFTADDRYGPLAPVRRFILACLLAIALAAVSIDRPELLREPVPIVMTTTYTPPRFGRSRPYRAHHRRTARIILQ